MAVGTTLTAAAFPSTLGAWILGLVPSGTAPRPAPTLALPPPVVAGPVDRPHIIGAAAVPARGLGVAVGVVWLVPRHARPRPLQRGEVHWAPRVEAAGIPLAAAIEGITGRGVAHGGARGGGDDKENLGKHGDGAGAVGTRRRRGKTRKARAVRGAGPERERRKRSRRFPGRGRTVAESGTRWVKQTSRGEIERGREGVCVL